MDDVTDIQYYPLDDIKREFLKYVPAYAQEQAQEAIYKVVDLQKQGLLRDGLYYVVLVDLVGICSILKLLKRRGLEDR